MKARGDSLTLPTLEFTEPVWNSQLGLGADDKMLTQLVVQGPLIETPGGADYPALIFTGRDVTSAPLPSWIYPAAAEQLTAAGELVTKMAATAIRAAREHNAARG